MKDEMILCKCGALNHNSRLACHTCEEPFFSATQEYTAINPRHYRSHPSGVEAIDIAEHMNFCLGNVVKYVWRAGLKGDTVEDLEKARWYLDREIKRRKK